MDSIRSGLFPRLYLRPSEAVFPRCSELIIDWPYRKDTSSIGRDVKIEVARSPFITVAVTTVIHKSRNLIGTLGSSEFGLK